QRVAAGGESEHKRDEGRGARAREDEARHELLRECFVKGSSASADVCRHGRIARASRRLRARQLPNARSLTNRSANQRRRQRRATLFSEALTVRAHGVGAPTTTTAAPEMPEFARAVAMIVVVPTESAVTTPVWSTVAICA